MRNPAPRPDVDGRPGVDLREVFYLAVPLIANSALQIVLSLTDTWFLGHVSTQALAAVGAVWRLIAIVMLVCGGVALAVHPMVTQAFGGRRYARASQAAWLGVIGALLTTPIFLTIAVAGRWLLRPFGLDLQLQELGAQFWLPRVAGAPVALAVSALFGFFTGISRPRVILAILLITTVGNAILNEIFVFCLNLGVAGSAWASTTASALALIMALAVLVSADYRSRYKTHVTWRIDLLRVVSLFRIGFPISLSTAADPLAMALFQIMEARVSAGGGAVTQIALMLSWIAYLPGLGIAVAGATLVGQFIGAGDRYWAMRVGNRVTGVTSVLMGGVGVLTALGGRWLIPLFTIAHDSHNSLLVANGVRVLWLLAICQVFYALYLCSSSCLRSAGDMIVPAVAMLILAWAVFIPLAYSFTFARGEGWVTGLPQLGWGVMGGWSAMTIYVTLAGTTLFVRWRSSVWMSMSPVGATVARNGSL